MQGTLNFAVLGSGNGGRAFCGQIAHKGYPVVMYEPLEETADFLKLREEKKLFLTGDIAVGGTLLDVTMDIKKAVDQADVVFIVVPSFAHPPIFEKMIPHLHDGQHAIIVPGNYGDFLPLPHRRCALSARAGHRTGSSGRGGGANRRIVREVELNASRCGLCN